MILPFLLTLYYIYFYTKLILLLVRINNIPLGMLSKKCAQYSIVKNVDKTKFLKYRISSSLCFTLSTRQRTKEHLYTVNPAFYCQFCAWKNIKTASVWGPHSPHYRVSVRSKCHRGTARPANRPAVVRVWGNRKVRVSYAVLLLDGIRKKCSVSFTPEAPTDDFIGM